MPNFAVPWLILPRENFADIKLHSGETGVPLFDEAMAYLECRVVVRYEGGDHREGYYTDLHDSAQRAGDAAFNN